MLVIILVALAQVLEVGRMCDLCKCRAYWPLLLIHSVLSSVRPEALAVRGTASMPEAPLSGAALLRMNKAIFSFWRTCTNDINRTELKFNF